MVAGIVQSHAESTADRASIITAFTAQHQKFVTEGTNIDKSIAQGMIAGIPQITGKVAQIMGENLAKTIIEQHTIPKRSRYLG